MAENLKSTNHTGVVLNPAVKADKKKHSTAKRKTSKKNFSRKPQTASPADEKNEQGREYRPVRQGREYRSGCLGGVMYFVFIVCCGIILACFLWMAASDALALNKESVSAVIEIPSSVFTTRTVDVFDEDGNPNGTKDVPEADISYVSSALKESGIVQYKWLFELFCKVSDASLKIDPGTYELKSTLDYRALIKNMQNGTGAAVTVDIMIPEGYSMNRIFLLLEEKGVSDYDELMDAAANYKFNYSFIDDEKLGDASRLEGYLFPDTYQFYVGMQASSAINKLLSNFNSKWSADIQKQAAEMNMSMVDIIKIASLIEKEAAVDQEKGIDERSLVSSVIYNRIAEDMTLGLESSILYVHQDYEGSPTAEMLTEDIPYNTNLYKGLPPTPICNPSLAAIQAALNPEDTGYLYFYYSESDGYSVFFSSYNEFTAYVESKKNE